MAKYLDENGLLYFWNKLKTLFAGKVDVESGKGLSTNDYTTAEKNKLAGIAAGANAYTLPAATTSTLGGVIVPSGYFGLAVNGSGQVTLNPAGNYIGGVKAGRGTYIASDGTISPDLTTATPDFREDLSSTEIALQTISPEYYSYDDDDRESLWVNLFVIPVATSSSIGLLSAADKSKLDGFSAASNYALKSDITSMYRHKGSVAAVANLPSSGNTAGDVYNITATGMNYVWTGSEWDALGQVFIIDSLTNAEIDTICV